GPENNYGAFFSSQEITQGLHAGTVQQRECKLRKRLAKLLQVFHIGIAQCHCQASPRAQKGATGIDPVSKHFLREMLRMTKPHPACSAAALKNMAGFEHLRAQNWAALLS